MTARVQWPLMSLGVAPYVFGVDLSLASTGLADSDGMTDRYVTKPAHTVPDTVARLAAIARWVSGKSLAADLVVIEGPSYGSPQQQHKLGGLWWITVARLVGEGLPLLVVTPAQRMKYATGRGNAHKDEVLAAAVKRYPEWDITGNDIADAVILAAIGARMLGHPLEDSLPKTHLAALANLPPVVTP